MLLGAVGDGAGSVPDHGPLVTLPCRCVGDQFALLEAAIALAMLLRRFSFELAVPAERVGMATGATIHTANGMQMRVRRRQVTAAAAGSSEGQQPVGAST
jgi:hypothetical protein